VELPHLQKIYNELKGRGFLVVTIAAEESGDKMKRLVDYSKITFPFLLDDVTAKKSEYQISYRVFDLYSAYAGKQYLIDGDGRVIEGSSKYVTTEWRLRDKLAALGIKPE
jgi:hypothetical protein